MPPVAQSTNGCLEAEVTLFAGCGSADEARKRRFILGVQTLKHLPRFRVGIAIHDHLHRLPVLADIFTIFPDVLYVRLDGLRVLVNLDSGRGPQKGRTGRPFDCFGIISGQALSSRERLQLVTLPASKRPRDAGDECADQHRKEQEKRALRRGLSGLISDFAYLSLGSLKLT
jgi:hypothetical protein